MLSVASKDPEVTHKKRNLPLDALAEFLQTELRIKLCTHMSKRGAISSSSLALRERWERVVIRQLLTTMFLHTLEQPTNITILLLQTDNVAGTTKTEGPPPPPLLETSPVVWPWTYPLSTALCKMLPDWSMELQVVPQMSSPRLTHLLHLTL